MKTSLKKQQGMTLISMVCIAIVVGSIFFLALAIMPIYMEHGKVKGALDSIKQTIETGGLDEGSAQITNRLLKTLNMNDVDVVTSENITVTRKENGHSTVHIQYEVVKKLVANASILVQFDDTVEIK